MLDEVTHTQTGVSPLAVTYGITDAGYFAFSTDFKTVSRNYVTVYDSRLFTMGTNDSPYIEIGIKMPVRSGILIIDYYKRFVIVFSFSLIVNPVCETCL